MTIMLYNCWRLANNKPILNKGGVLAIGFNPSQEYKTTLL